MSNVPLMPIATAVWLVENTTLTFKQIANFCNLHEIEVQGIADGDVAKGIKAYNPILAGQLTREEIEECSKDSSKSIVLNKKDLDIKSQKRKQHYIPLSKRQDRPDAATWLIKNFSQLSDGQISKLVGTTKPTINGVRNRTHWNINNIKPRDPVALGLVARDDLTAAIEKANRAFERAEKRKAKASKNYQPVQSPAATIEEQTPVVTEAVAKDGVIAEKDLTAEDVFGGAKPAPETVTENTVAEKKVPVTPPDDGNPFAALGQLISQNKGKTEESKNDTDDQRD